MVLFLALYSLSVTELPAQSFTLNIWIDRGCGGEYHVGDMITVYWEASHACQITLWEKEPDGTRRKVGTGPIMSGAGEGSKGWTLGDYGYGERVIQANASSLYGEDSDECRFYVVEDNGAPQDTDTDRDGIPDSQDSCYNTGCTIVDSRGCPQDADDDGVDDCEDDCPSEKGPSYNDGCPIGDADDDGVTDDKDSCYNPDCSIVDSQGCPKDADDDGINDCEDDCPYERGPSSTDGCPSEQTTTLTPIPTATAAPTTDEPQPYNLIVYFFLFLVAVAVIGVLALIKRSRKERTLPPTVPGDRTQTYDDDTRIY